MKTSDRNRCTTLFLSGLLSAGASAAAGAPSPARTLSAPILTATAGELAVQNALILLSLLGILIWMIARLIRREHLEVFDPNTSQNRRWKHPAFWRSLTAAAAYLVFASLWILLSDRALDTLVLDREMLVLAGMGKGLLFVTLSAGLVFWLFFRSSREMLSAATVLRDREDRLRAIFDNSAIGISLVQLDGAFVQTNYAFRRMVGYTEEDLATSSFKDMTHPDDRAENQRLYAELIQGQRRDFQMEKRYRHKEGHWVWARTTVSLVRGGDGQPRFAVAIVEDITEHKLTASALNKTQVNLEAAQARAKLGSWELDLATQKAWWSAEMYRLHGRDAAQEPPNFEEYLELVHPDDQAAITASYQRALESRSAVTMTLDHRTHPRWGPVRWLSSRLQVICDRDNLPRQLAGTTLDVTERREAEEMLRELSAQLMRLQDEERRRIARELHDHTAQHLAAVAMNLASLRKFTEGSGAKTEKILADTVALTEKASQEIRTVSYLLHPPLLDAVGLPGAVRDYATGFAQRSGIEVNVEVGPEWVRLPPDVELALFRVVQEGLGNVRRHSGGQSATIRLAREGAVVTLELEDTGQGMSGDQLEKITKTKSAVGVGIAGMRERLHQLRGQLEVESDVHGTILRAIVPVPS